MAKPTTHAVVLPLFSSAAQQPRNRTKDKPGTIAKRVLLDRIRRAHGCADCGTREGLLHFDHRPDTVKLLDPAHTARYSMPRLLAEVAKCDVRCAACHVRRHHTLPEDERRARVRARWQRWYQANRGNRTAAS